MDLWKRKQKTADLYSELEAVLGHETMLQIKVTFSMVKQTAQIQCTETTTNTQCRKKAIQI